MTLNWTRCELSGQTYAHTSKGDYFIIKGIGGFNLYFTQDNKTRDIDSFCNTKVAQRYAEYDYRESME